MTLLHLIIVILLTILNRRDVNGQQLGVQWPTSGFNPVADQNPQYTGFGSRPYGNQLYSGHQVSPYGSLAFTVGRMCDARVENDPDFQKCRTEAVVDWGSTTYTDRQIKYLCCYTWDIVDCMETAVQYRCARREFDFEDYYRNFAIRKEELRNSLERYQCVDYPYRSIKCHFFWWVIAIIVIVVFTIILIVAAVCYKLLRKKSSNSRSIRTTDVKVNY